MGLCLRRLVLQYHILGWQGSTGISGSFQSESVATFDWNRWQGSTGISGNLRAEYADVAAMGETLTVTTPATPPPLSLQLLLQLVEEAPVGALGDDLLGARFDHPGLMQPEGVEADRIFGIVVSPRL